jgi:hypothetical protein
MKNLKDGDALECPHCKKEQASPVEDFCLSWAMGQASRVSTGCEWCDGFFAVERNADATFKVDKSTDPELD